MTQPIIKWVGGKGRLLSELVPRMPQWFDRYYEPFVGGAALFFHAQPQRAVLNDQNQDLINLYSMLRTDVDAVIRRLRRHRNEHNRRHYYSVREQWNNPERRWKPRDRAAAFVYLNKTCFNGLWRVNKSGEFNVPIGDYDHPMIYAAGNLRMAAKQLAHARIMSGDYRHAVNDAIAGDFIYFDPPYDPINATSSFTKYSAGGFTRDDQTQLAELARSLVKRGCYVMLSNNDTRFVRKLYKGFEIERVLCGRSINSDIAKRAAVGELIIRGGYA